MKEKPGIYLDVITVLWIVWIGADLLVELVAKRNGKSSCLCLSCRPTEINLPHLSCEFLYSEFWLQMDKAEGGVT